MSELVPGHATAAALLPATEPIISGLSRAVVVVEAGEQSGSLITARCALEQGRDVLAVPGNVLTAETGAGTCLLRDGAKIVETADDIFEELGSATAVGRPGDARFGPRGRSARRRCLRICRRAKPVDLDEIAERSGLGPARLLAAAARAGIAGAGCAAPGRPVRSDLTDRVRV